MKAFGTIKKGNLILNNKRRFKDNLLEYEGKEVEIRIRERKNKRTNEQNSLYWKWIEVISKSLGYTREEMHELIKYKFLKRSTIKKNGVEEVRLKSTTTLTVNEFSQFMNDIYFWSNNTLNISLPTYE